MINETFREFDPARKTKDWFRRILLDIMSRKKFLISEAEYRLNESYADGTYDVGWIKKQYDVFNQPADSLNMTFEPLDILGHRINSIVSMIEKIGFAPKAQTTDPTARDKKDADIELLKAEKQLEPLRKKFGEALGIGQPLQISKESDFSSDISPVSKMGLDISNPIDEGIFRDYLQRQVWEIALEVGSEHYLKQNEYNEKLKLVLRDLVNQGCAAQQVVINSYSGEPMLSYIYPFNAYTIVSKQPDGKDGIGKGWEKNVTVREVIAIMGKDVTLEDLESLLSQANTNGNTNYQGVWMYGDRYDPSAGFSYPYGASRDKCCEWQYFLNMTCSLGYLELKSQDSDLYLHRKENGNLFTIKKEYDYTAPENIRKRDSIEEIERDSDRFLEYKFYDVTYKGYYLPFSNIVFGFGKLPLAVRYGTKNELTDYSIITQRLRGKSMTQKCIPFVKHIMSLWAKIQYFINESRPSGESWDIDTVREISQEIIGISANESKILETLKVLQNNTNTVHKTVKTVDGQPIGGDADPVKQRVRGLDPTVIQMYELIQRDKNQIIEITGVSDVLLATQTNDRAGLGVSQIALQQSLNTIYYIQSATQKMFSDVCFSFAQKIQYIVNGDKSTEAYKSVIKAIGERNVEAIKLMGDTPSYAYSIFIEWGMNQIQRDQVDQLTNLLVQSKSITAAQAFQIKDVRNWKLAGALLAYYDQKQLQMAQQNQIQAIQAGIQGEDQKHKNKMEEIALENQGRNEGYTIQGQYAVEQEKIKLSGKSDIEDKRQISKMLHSQQSHEQNLEEKNLETPKE